ncbi:MAG TPA: sialidase family protein, partial [Aquihabitans sp.]|nr:sialidase family protein [Aquihabitans sp.]
MHRTSTARSSHGAHRPARRPRPLALAALAATALLGALALAPGTADAAPGDIGNQGPDFVDVVNPTEATPESKLWFHDGAWWAVQVKETGQQADGDPTGSTIIRRLDPATNVWTDAAIIDNRGTAKADVLSEGGTLSIALHKTDRDTGVLETNASNFSRFYRFTYNAGAKTYTKVGFTVMNKYEMKALTVDRASNGTLWAAWTMGTGQADPPPPALGARKVWTQSSVDDGATWSEPAPMLDQRATATEEDVASVIAFGDRVGVMWSDQSVNDGFWFATHTAAPGGAWTPAEDAYVGLNRGDGHLNLKEHNGEVYAAVKTRNDTGQNPLIVLLKRTAGATGQWSNRTAWVGSTNVTRPVVQIDATSNEANVFVTGPVLAAENGELGGVIYGKKVGLATGT